MKAFRPTSRRFWISRSTLTCRAGHSALVVLLTNALSPAPRIDPVGPLPDDVQPQSACPAAVASKGTQGAAPNAFVFNLKSPAAVAVIEAGDMISG